ncbi:PTS glucose transporter subunit IIA [Bifidobacterium moukalabense]|nr:PTS glucose transporter subunit IIA [Bifidobacterium moukalabense]
MKGHAMAGFFASLFHKKADASVSDSDEDALVTSPADDSCAEPLQEERLPVRIELCSPADGAAKSLEEVADDVFSTKVLGDGFAVTPSNGLIVAPVSGTITTIANAKHAVGITTESGIEALVHIGIDTVQLEGGPFTLLVQPGQRISAGEPIDQVDLAAVHAAGKLTDVIVVFTNADNVDAIDITAHGAVLAGSPVGALITH